MPRRKVQLMYAALMALLLGHASPSQAFGKKDARNGAECRDQVNAQYDAVVEEMRQHGNYRGIISTNTRARAEDLAECDQMDQRAREKTMVAATERLEAAIANLRKPADLAPGVASTLARDHAAIAAFPPAPYREYYLRKWLDYQRYAALTKAGASPAAGSSCAELRANLVRSKEQHDQAVTALLNASGPAAGGDWRQYEKQRVTALSDMQFQRDQARLAGCASEEGSPHGKP